MINTNGMEEKSKKMSIKVFLTGLVLIALILVGGISTCIGVYNLRVGMEDEVEQGVKATCQTYAMVLLNSEDPEDTTSTMEQDLHSNTGYDYTYFIGDTRARSSIAGAVGTKAGTCVNTRDVP